MTASPVTTVENPGKADDVGVKDVSNVVVSMIAALPLTAGDGDGASEVVVSLIATDETKDIVSISDNFIRGKEIELSWE